MPALVEAELRLVKPKLLVCLGATAAQPSLVLISRTRERGKCCHRARTASLATVHPSSLLRQPDEDQGTRIQTFVPIFRRSRSSGEEELAGDRIPPLPRNCLTGLRPETESRSTTPG